MFQQTQHNGCSTSRADVLGDLVLYLLAFPALTTYLVALGLLLRIPATPWHLLPALVGGGVVTRRVTGCDWRRLLVLGIGVSCLSFALALLMGLFIDGSWDANLYHYPATYALADGWNPVWQPKIEDFAGFWQIRGCWAIHGQWCPWANVYPKAAWYLAAPWTRMLVSAETGNFSHLYYMIVSFLAIGWMLRGRVPQVDRWCVAVAGAAGSVSLSQVSAGYVDGLLGTLLVLGIFSLWAFWRERDGRLLVIAALTLPLAANLKFTGAAYVGVLLVLFALPFWRSGKYWRLVGAVCLFSALVGVNPYLTNTVRYGSPLYPVMTLDPERPDVDVVAVTMPTCFKDVSRVRRFALSHFVLDADSGWRPLPEQTKWRRWTNYKDHYIGWMDLRVGGFGPMFRLAFLLGLVLAAFSVRDRSLWFTCAAVMVSVLLNRHAWWARLVPHMACVPVLLVLGIAMSGRWWARWLARGLVAILVVNACLIGKAVIGQQFRETDRDLCRLINYMDSGRKGGIVFSIDPGSSSQYASIEYRLEKRLDVHVDPDPSPDTVAKHRDFPVSLRAASRARDEEMVGVEDFLGQVDGCDALLIAANEASIASGPIGEWLRAKGCDLPPDLDASKKRADMRGFACIMAKGQVARQVVGVPARIWYAKVEGHEVTISAWPAADRHTIVIDGRYYSLNMQGTNFVAIDIEKKRVHVAGFRPGQNRGPHWFLPLRPITVRDRLAMLFGRY